MLSGSLSIANPSDQFWVFPAKFSSYYYSISPVGRSSKELMSDPELNSHPSVCIIHILYGIK